MTPTPRFSPRALLVAALCGTPACALPPDSTHLDSFDEPVHIWGYTVTADRDVAIECSPMPFDYAEPSPWVQVAVTQSTPEPLSQAGETVYPFDTMVVFPEHCWRPFPGLDHTFARIVDVTSGQVHAWFTYGGYDCLVSEFFQGAGPKTAYDACVGLSNSRSQIQFQGPN